MKLHEVILMFMSISNPAAGANVNHLSATHICWLLLLGAIWGASFLFMRAAAPEFGAILLIAIRVTIAAACLLPLIAFNGAAWASLLRNKRALLLVGIFNSAVPFCLFAFSTLYLPAGLASLLNATAVLWGSVLGSIIWRVRLAALQWVGVVIGFAGVLLLVRAKLVLPTAVPVLKLVVAIAAALMATLLYGLCANYTRSRLSHVPSLVIAAGSQLAASVVLMPFGLAFWPLASIGTGAWMSVIVLGMVCTALAYLLYFQLIAEIGAPRTMTVTLLVPVFGVLMGAIFLEEPLQPHMILGGAIVLSGTALTMRSARGRH
jgi:drug/metabolite transporter (DMT)-like permease